MNNLPDPKEIFSGASKEKTSRRKNPRQMWERKKLEDMVHCKDCHDCVMRKSVLAVQGDPKKICEEYLAGICISEEAQWPHTLEEISQILGITRERVRQIELKAIRKLRHPKRSKRLRSFYEDSVCRETR